jgi:putative transposase
VGHPDHSLRRVTARHRANVLHDLDEQLAHVDEAILTYVEAHNENGKPFKWTKTADEILEKMRRFGLRTQQVHG